MWGSRKPLDESRIATLLEEQNALLRENNALQREVYFALTSHLPRTPPSRSLPKDYVPKTEKDVVVATRSDRAQMQAHARAREQAPWRGPASPASPDATTAVPSDPPSIGITPTPLL